GGQGCEKRSGASVGDRHETVGGGVGGGCIEDGISRSIERSGEASSADGAATEAGSACEGVGERPGPAALNPLLDSATVGGGAVVGDIESVGVLEPEVVVRVGASGGHSGKKRRGVSAGGWGSGSDGSD